MNNENKINSFHNFEAEQSVLGIILSYPDEVLENIDLSYSDFFETRHRHLFKAVEGIRERNIDLDLITINDWLSEKKTMELAGGLEYISQLASAVYSSANFETHAAILKRLSRKRNSQKALQKMLVNLETTETDEEMDDLISKGYQYLNDSRNSHKNSYVHIRNVMVDVMDQAGIFRDSDMLGPSTGFPSLDRMTLGIKSREVTILGGRPGCGKTACMLNLVMNTSSNGALVPVYSLEMANMALGQRILSSETRINSKKIKLGANSLTTEDFNKMATSIGGISENNDVLLSEKTTVSIKQIKSDLITLRKENPDREIICFIDYLQLIKGSKEFQGNRTQEVGDISRILKELALTLDLHIVALAQLSRNVEQRQDKRPMLSDIRESGEIEQNADNVWFLYREDYYDSETENKGIVECIIAKQREGEVGTVHLKFEKEFGRFINIGN